jgi:hypothetical protein
MFSNGTEALANFKEVLSSDESYNTSPPEDHSVTGKDNYCYLRCRNNTDTAIKAYAQMFYVPSSLILWTDAWSRNAMKVDITGSDTNTISEMAPGAVGVVDRPFVWERPQQLANGLHYCLVGRIFTDSTPNPIPYGGHPIEMATIIETNLMFAKRNITIIDGDTSETFFSYMLTTPASLKKAAKFHMFMYVKDVTGWEVDCQCSMTDANGDRIGMDKTTITGDKDIYMGQCVLEPGFSAMVTVNINTNGKYTENSKISVRAEYAADQDDVKVLNDLYIKQMKKNGVKTANISVPSIKTDTLSVIRANDKNNSTRDTVGTIDFGQYTAIVRKKK